MIGDRKQQARFQSTFYRDNYHKVLNGLIYLNILSILVIIAIIYFILFHPATEYYATTPTGKIIPMVLKS